MISVLIPAKDYCCKQLIEELHKQGEELQVPFEILIGEDGTSPENLQLNMSAEVLPFCRRIIRTENIGRANIRNLLALEARFENLLFIDCDAIVEKDNFLAAYITALNDAEVVCGGLYHTNKLPGKEYTLRFKYEKKADKSRSATIRSTAPYDKFTTFNFAIHKELFTSIFFNTEITQYGYEDTLLGKELEKRNANILHIDNPLLHNGIEDNATYLSKVEQSIKTLISIKEEIASTPLLDCAAKLQRYHLAGLFLFLWKATQKQMRRNLLGKNPSLKILNIYKLGFFLKHSR